MTTKKTISDDCNCLELALQKDILSLKEAAVYMDISESLLYKLTSRSEINFSKPNNGRIYFKKSDLNNWMLQNASQSTNSLESGVLNYLAKKGGKNG